MDPASEIIVIVLNPGSTIAGQIASRGDDDPPAASVVANPSPDDPRFPGIVYATPHIEDYAVRTYRIGRNAFAIYSPTR